MALSVVSLLLGAGIGAASAEPSQPVAARSPRPTAEATGRPQVTVTVTETAPAPRPVTATVTETAPAPPPVTITVTETAQAPPPVAAAPIPEPADGCSPAYSGTCVPAGVGDVDCTELAARDFSSVGSDPYGLDGDDDGVACES